jgi:hypothetical protein
VTGADFTGVDIDLLADYVGGALDGTPDQARVASLIAEEPAWRDAHALLSAGMAEVGTELHEWGTEPEPMPTDIFARLESALALPGERPEEIATVEPSLESRPGSTTVDAAPGPRLKAVPASTGEDLDGGAAASGPRLESVRKKGFDRRRRGVRWSASLAAAAAAVGVAGLGIAYLGSGSSSSHDSTTSKAAGAASMPGIATLPGGVITSTDRDYTADGLRGDEVAPFSAGSGSIAPKAPPSALATPDNRGESSKGIAGGEGLTDALARLRPAAALQTCLDAIGTANGVGTITVQSVDFARFAGRPALIVHFTAANGDWAWVSGPACGLPGVGPATAYSVQVG